MRRTIALTALTIALVFAMVNQELSAHANQHGTRYFCGTGRVISIDDDKSGVTIAHQTIVGYMPAMTMHFKASDPEVLSDISAGDKVRFTLRDTFELTRLIYIERVAPKPRQRRER